MMFTKKKNFIYTIRLDILSILPNSNIDPKGMQNLQKLDQTYSFLTLKNYNTYTF